MARPTANIILQKDIDPEHSMEVLEGTELWTVTYNDTPINLRKSLYTVIDRTMFKYARTTFTSKSPAVNLATRLNRWFDTQAFQARRVL